MVLRFEFLVHMQLDLHCPTKLVKISNLDGRICTPEIKQACRRKNREYHQHGNSARYKELKKLVKTKLKEATTAFLDKQLKKSAKSTNAWLKHVKKIAARPGDQPSMTFSLPQHMEDELSALESSDKICQFFTSVFVVMPRWKDFLFPSLPISL